MALLRRLPWKHLVRRGLASKQKQIRATEHASSLLAQSNEYEQDKGFAKLKERQKQAERIYGDPLKAEDADFAMNSVTIQDIRRISKRLATLAKHGHASRAFVLLIRLGGFVQPQDIELVARAFARNGNGKTSGLLIDYLFTEYEMVPSLSVLAETIHAAAMEDPGMAHHLALFCSQQYPSASSILGQCWRDVGQGWAHVGQPERVKVAQSWLKGVGGGDDDAMEQIRLQAAVKAVEESPSLEQAKSFAKEWVHSDLPEKGALFGALASVLVRLHRMEAAETALCSAWTVGCEPPPEQDAWRVIRGWIQVGERDRARALWEWWTTACGATFSWNDVEGVSTASLLEHHEERLIQLLDVLREQHGGKVARVLEEERTALEDQWDRMYGTTSPATMEDIEGALAADWSTKPKGFRHQMLGWVRTLVAQGRVEEAKALPSRLNMEFDPAVMAVIGDVEPTWLEDHPLIKVGNRPLWFESQHLRYLLKQNKISEIQEKWESSMQSWSRFEIQELVRGLNELRGYEWVEQYMLDTVGTLSPIQQSVEMEGWVLRALRRFAPEEHMEAMNRRVAMHDELEEVQMDHVDRGRAPPQPRGDMRVDKAKAWRGMTLEYGDRPFELNPLLLRTLHDVQDWDVEALLERDAFVDAEFDQSVDDPSEDDAIRDLRTNYVWPDDMAFDMNVKERPRNPLEFVVDKE